MNNSVFNGENNCESFELFPTVKKHNYKEESSILKISSFSQINNPKSSTLLEKNNSRISISGIVRKNSYKIRNEYRKDVEPKEKYQNEPYQSSLMNIRNGKKSLSRPISSTNPNFKKRNFVKYQTLIPKYNAIEENWDLRIVEELFPFLKKKICEKENLNSKSNSFFRSIFLGRPNVIYFGKDLNSNQVQNLYETKKLQFSVLKFKALDSCEVLNEVLISRGYSSTKGTKWKIIWGFVNPEFLSQLQPNQKVNHFPGCWNLGRKDSLLRYFLKMNRNYPEEYNYIPQTFLLQNEEKRYEQMKSSGLWIIKPCASSRGRGIRLLRSNSSLPKKNKKNYLISKYIENPHLINGYKYDLRVYVLVTSFDPLILYVYEDGLVRFATSLFSKKKGNLSNIFAHVTNFSINKNSPSYQDCDDDGKGSKWSFEKLKLKYEELGISFDYIFNQIKDIAIKTCISVEHEMLLPINKCYEHRRNCFELYGFDILIDNNLKAWLLEVNVSPSLQTKTFVDKKVKFPLIEDILNILGLEAFEIKKKRVSKENITGHHISILNDLNSSNVLEKLKIKDWDILLQISEEFSRKGNFVRAFPNKENIERYGKLFQCEKWNNKLLWNFLESEIDYLEILINKIKQKELK